jgi:hypothetical protein
MSKKVLKRLVVGLLFLYCISLIVYISNHSDQLQWDFEVYYYAAKAYAAGLNPYDVKTVSEVAQTPRILHLNLKFVYLPVTLLFFRLFLLVDYNTAFHLFLVLKCILLIGLVYLWRKEFLKGEKDLLFYFFCLLAFNGAIYLDMRAGNISILEQFLIWVAFYFFLRRRVVLFCLFILVAAIFKVTPLLFLFLLWFSKERKKYIYAIGSFILFLAIQLMSYMTSPHLLVNFVHNACGLPDYGIKNPSTFTLVRHLLHLLSDKTGIVMTPKIELAVFFAIIAVIIFVARRAYMALGSVRVKDKERIVLFLACLVYALILPRFKDYSYILLIVPAYFILSRVNYLKVFPLLFIFTTLSSRHIMLPGLGTIFGILWEYYPLIVAYCILTLYLYDIFIITRNREEIEIERPFPH